MLIDESILGRVLTLLGVGFFAASLRLFLQFFRFRRLRSSAVLTWPGRRPPYYGLLLLLGAIFAALIICKIVFLHRPPIAVFGETMMLLYYGYAVPLAVRIPRGFYEEGIWSEGGFVRYSQIGGMTWREGREITLVLIDRVRRLARKLIVPDAHYAAARRLLRDKIAAHDIQFAAKALDLGVRDERDDV